MIAFIQCFQCEGEARKLAKVQVSATELTRWVCPFGHEQWPWAQNPFYELLFLRGIYDLADRDYRNSVLNLFGAYEAFVATTLELFALGAERLRKFEREGISPEVGYRLVYSERVGTDAGQLPPIVRDLRNAVAHRAAVPSRAEVLEAGEAIRAHIVQAIDALQPLHKDNAVGEGARVRFAKAWGRTPPPRPASENLGELFASGANQFALDLSLSVEELSSIQEKLWQFRMV
jgi:hypothetical protein